MPKPALLVLTSTYPRRAGDTTPAFVAGLCRQLAAGFDVHVLAPHAPGIPRSEVMDAVHVHRYRYLPDSWQQLAYDGGITARLRRRPWLVLQVPCLLLAQFVAALRLARALRPRVIHAHWLLPQGLVAVAVRALCVARPALLCTLHGTDMHGWNFPPLPALKGRLLRAMDHVTAVSGVLRAAAVAAGADPARVEVAPMGVDVDGDFHAGTAAQRIPGSAVFVGRLVPGKGVDVLLRAWARLPPATGVLLKIVGDGPLRADLESRAHDLGIMERVCFTGALPAPAVGEALRSAAVAVFPYTGAEGLGIAVVEAQACGCPVIVSAIAAVADTVRDGNTGLQVPPGDDGALAAAIGRVFADPALAGRLSGQGSSAARATFSWSRVAAGYTRILVDLTSRAARGAA